MGIGFYHGNGWEWEWFYGNGNRNSPSRTPLLYTDVQAILSTNTATLLKLYISNCAPNVAGGSTSKLSILALCNDYNTR